MPKTKYKTKLKENKETVSALFRKAELQQVLAATIDEEPLNDSQLLFCKEYCWDYNATRAYRVAYPKASNSSASANGTRLLGNDRIAARIEYLKAHTAESIGITRDMIADEYRKIAFSSIAHLHNTWIELKEFDKLTNDQKECIQEITTQTRHETAYDGDDKIDITVDYVKIKLYDKLRAIEGINKMLGYDAPVKIDLGGAGLGGTVNIQVNIFNTAPPLADDEEKIKG